MSIKWALKPGSLHCTVSIFQLGALRPVRHPTAQSRNSIYSWQNFLKSYFCLWTESLSKAWSFFFNIPFKSWSPVLAYAKLFARAEQAINTNGLQEQRSKNDLQPGSLGFSLVPCFVLPSPTPSGPRTISCTVDTHPLPSTPALAPERATWALFLCGSAEARALPNNYFPGNHTTLFCFCHAARVGCQRTLQGWIVHATLSEKSTIGLFAH